jgi:putative (di)nucleoside polyphosphate hydrolase
MIKTTSLYRPNIGIMVINGTGQVLVCHRSDVKDDTAWQMVQGGIDENESPIAAAFRELEEETGIKRDDVKRIDFWDEFLYYDFPIELITPYNEVVGQKQKWLVVQYLLPDNSIDLKQAKDKEFNDYKWVSMDEAVNLIWKPKKTIYQRLAKKYKQYLAA